MEMTIARRSIALDIWFCFLLKICHNQLFVSYYIQASIMVLWTFQLLDKDLAKATPSLSNIVVRSIENEWTMAIDSYETKRN